MNNFYSLYLQTSTNQIEVYPNSGLSVDYNLVLPSTAPTSNTILRWNASISSLEWYDLSNISANSTPTSTFTLLSTVTGTPSSNASYTVNRGTSDAATISWNETTDKWEIGVVGAIKSVGRSYSLTFTNSDLVSSVLTVTHNLGVKPVIQVFDNNDVEIGVDVTHTSSNVFTLNLSRMGTLAGTWELTAVG